MRFMIIRKADEESEGAGIPSPELVEAMTKYHEDLAAAGLALGGAGLQPSSQGARVEFTGGEPTVTDGPFAEAKELIAGYTVVEADSLETVVEWARKWPVEDANGNARLEIRRFYEFDDFGDAFDEGQRERLDSALGADPTV